MSKLTQGLHRPARRQNRRRGKKPNSYQFSYQLRDLLLWLVTLAGLAALPVLFARQGAPADDATASSGPPKPFAQVVKECFSQWDINGDGILSPDEFDAAMANPRFKGESAAALAAIRVVVHGHKYTLPPTITQAYLVSSPLREPSTSDEQAALLDDPSKPGKFEHRPAFQTRYVNAVRRLRSASRDLFPQSLPAFDAIHQRILGDCPFVSTVGAMVYRNPSAVRAMFAQDPDGSTMVALGNGRTIRIACITDADIALFASAGTNGLWLTVLEKAYRRVLLAARHPEQQDRPSVYAGFGSARTIEILDGHRTRTVQLQGIRPGTPQLAALRQDLKAAQCQRRLVKAGTPPTKSTPGIPHTHAFAILGYDPQTDLVHMWNPWGKDFKPKGPDGLQNGYRTKTGQFEIPLTDFLRVFRDVIFETQVPAGR